MYLDIHDLRNVKIPVYPKIIGVAPNGREQVYVHEAQPFYAIQDDALLDTKDLEFICGCSRRTLYRWINEHGLKPFCRTVGGEMLFQKGDVVAWWNANRPQRGRPPG